MTELQRRWEAFRQTPFPDGQASGPTADVDLVGLDTFAAGCIGSVVDGEVLGPDRLAVLGKCREELDAVLPRLSGEARAYFQELAWLAREALETRKRT